MLTRASLIEGVRRVPPWVADTVLAVAIFAIGVMELVFFAQRTLVVPPFRVALVWSIPVFAVMSLPLAIRRRNVWAAYLLIEAAAVVAGQTHLVAAYGLASLQVFTVLLYSVGERSNALVTAALTLGQVGYYYSLEFEAQAQFRDPNPLLWNLVRYLPFLGLAAFAGWAHRRRRKLTAELQARVAEVQRERELLAGQAVRQERVRIARELRALVLQGVDRMTRFALSARQNVKGEPDRARTEIGAIETVGRGTLVEMRRLLGVLRRVDQAADENSTEADELAMPGEESPGWTPGRRPSARMMDRLRRWSARPWLIDAAIAVAIGGLAVLEFAQADPMDSVLSGWLPRALTTLIVLGVLFRRAAPFTVLVVIASSELAWILLRDGETTTADVAVLIAVFTVAAHKDIRWAVVAVGMGILAWIPYPVKDLCLCLIHRATLSTFALIAGHSMLVGRQINRELQEQTELLQRTRRERVRLAVAEERTRVAREMHDVVAHAVTGMVVQAGGARMVAADDPQLAEATLQDIQQMGLEALKELRALVETLDPPHLPTAAGPPEETPPDVGSLIERARRAGQEVAFNEEGEAHADQGLQISLYRIVQEALTNIRKHAPGTRAGVMIRHLPQGVEVEVTNGEPAAMQRSAVVPGAGQGLIGIRERAAVFGGTVEAGSTPDGGFRVFARLPRELVPA